MKIEDVFAKLPRLETDRLLLRKIEPWDEADMYAYCADPEVSRYTSWSAHPGIDYTRSFIEWLTGKYNDGQVAPWGIVEKASGTLIGTIGFVHWEPAHAKAELGYALSREYWNRGIMSEAVRRILSFGFETMGLIRIEARCLPDNTGSSRVMEKVGMSYEGRLRKQAAVKGKQEDMLLYSAILLSEPTSTTIYWG